MQRPIVCAVVSAAAIAAGLTFGLEGLNALHSDSTSRPDQNSASAKVESHAPQARDESRVESAPVRMASAVATDDVSEEGLVAVSARAHSTQLLSQALAQWNVLVLFRAGRLDGTARSSPQVAAASVNPPDAAKELEPGPPLPKARPAVEKSLPVKLASAAPDLEAPTFPQPPAQPPSLLGLFDKVFKFPPRASFPAEASGKTAVYDIETRAVYLPGGEVLEAHSGLGEHMDDVRYVQARMRGPTPPNVYTLTLREKPFHGVQAIRLTPVLASNMYGRAGILAHPYMLGPNGQSNGCVSIQNYPKFLEAYLKGKIDRLVVVPRLAATPEIVNASATVEKRPAANRPI
jgi:hypothetical protein